MKAGGQSVCAIVPTFNRADMLRECVESLLGQTLPPDQIIVVNDGSKDHTRAVVDSFGDAITYLEQPNSGKATALNLALSHCEADLVWICDDDDIAAPTALQVMSHALSLNPEAGFCFGKYRLFEVVDGERRFFDPGLLEHPQESNLELIFLEQMITCQFAMLVRRRCYEAAGPFRLDLIRSQDYEMLLRLIDRFPAVRLDDIAFFQRQHAGFRGAQDSQFDVSKRELKWLEYDRRIFEKIHAEKPIDAFTPTFALNWSSALKLRAAHLERACIFARKAMWEIAIRDFEIASDLSTQSLTPEETALVEHLISYELSWRVLHSNTTWSASYRRLSARNAVAAQIAMAACRSLVWMMRTEIRQGHTKPALILASLMTQLLGPKGFIRRLTLSLWPSRRSDVKMAQAA